MKWLLSRLNERSTVLAIGHAVATAFVVPWPYSAISLAFCLWAAFMADGEVKQPKE